MSGTELVLVFLKAAFLSVNGSTTLALLKSDLVDRLGVLDAQTYATAVAIGSSSPGPLGYGAIALGFFAAGWAGALLAALTSWMPAFLSLPIHAFYGKLEKQPWLAGLTWGVGAAGTGLLVGMIVDLGVDALTGWKAPVLAGISLLFLMRKASPVTVLLAAGVVGAIVL
jgi:chromate transporter